MKFNFSILLLFLLSISSIKAVVIENNSSKPIRCFFQNKKDATLNDPIDYSIDASPIAQGSSKSIKLNSGGWTISCSTTSDDYEDVASGMGSFNISPSTVVSVKDQDDHLLIQEKGRPLPATPARPLPSTPTQISRPAPPLPTTPISITTPSKPTGAELLRAIEAMKQKKTQAGQKIEQQAQVDIERYKTFSQRQLENEETRLAGELAKLRFAQAIPSSIDKRKQDDEKIIIELKLKALRNLKDELTPTSSDDEWE